MGLSRPIGSGLSVLINSNACIIATPWDGSAGGGGGVCDLAGGGGGGNGGQGGAGGNTSESDGSRPVGGLGGVALQFSVLDHLLMGGGGGAGHQDESDVPGTISQEATGPSGAWVSYSRPSASDAQDGLAMVTCAPVPGGWFPVGETTVTCSVADFAGNTAQASFVVDVVDTTSRLLKLPPDFTAEATSASGASVAFDAIATHLVDGAVAMSCTPASGDTLSLGTPTVTCTATDGHGNAASGSFSVIVQDTSAPALQCPAPLTVPSPNMVDATVTFTPTVTDAVTFAGDPLRTRGGGRGSGWRRFLAPDGKVQSARSCRLGR